MTRCVVGFSGVRQGLLTGLLALGAISSLPVAATTAVAAAAPSEQAMDQRLDQLFGNHHDYRRFFESFQQAVVSGDKTKVAALIQYPITVHLDGRQWTLYNAQEFTDAYARIFTPGLLDLVRKQRYADLFANDQGVMFGQGAIWFSGICDDTECQHVRIVVVAMNLPKK